MNMPSARLSEMVSRLVNLAPITRQPGIVSRILPKTIASPAPEPIGSAMSYDADIDRARRLLPLVKEGFATSLTEAATRFAISHPAMGTILVGLATPQQFEDSLAAVEKGPLPQAALDRLSALQRSFAGEAR